jgi:hypothetical protein
VTNTPLHTSEAEPSGPVEITKAEAEELLARAVKERGKRHVYRHPVVPGYGELCVYFNPEDGAPSCIVGHVLAYKGLSLDSLVQGDINLNTYAAVGTLIDLDVIKVDSETQALLEIAQSEQDSGMPWGRAVKEARETCGTRAEQYETEGYDDPSDAYFA